MLSSAITPTLSVANESNLVKRLSVVGLDKIKKFSIPNSSDQSPSMNANSNTNNNN